MIDECISPRSLAVAHERSHDATRVNDQGLALFVIALDAIAARRADMINQLVEVDHDGAVTFSLYPFDGANG